MSVNKDQVDRLNNDIQIDDDSKLDDSVEQPLIQSEPKQKRGKDKYANDVENFNVREASKIENGLVQSRGCTDCLCLIIFLGFMFAMIFVTFSSYKDGNMDKLMAPIDHLNRFCGIDEGVENYKFLYFSDINQDKVDAILTSGLCVKYCPNQGQTVDCDSDDATCVTLRANPDATYKTQTFLNYCLPDLKALEDSHADHHAQAEAAINEMKSKFLEMLNSKVGSVFKDLYLSSRAVTWSCLLSFVWCIIFIYLMSSFAEQIAWIIIVLVQLGLLGASVFSILSYLALKKEDEAEKTSSDGTAENTREDTERTLLIVGSICGVVALIYFTLLCCFFKSLKIAIDVIDAAADFLAATKRVIVVPVVYFFINGIILLLWVPAIICIMSMSFESVEPDLDQPQMKSVTLTSDKDTRDKVFALEILMVFGILWILAFQQAKVGFIAMVSASSYYFDSNKKKAGHASVGMGFKFTYLNHSGSLALGSGIIAFLQLIRIIFHWVADKAEKASLGNPVTKIIARCGDCCLACLEKCTDYINTSGYAYMAVSGDKFCTSAWNGFLLNLKHAAKFGFAKFLAALFIMIVKLAVVILNCLTLYFIMAKVTKDTEELDSLVAPFVFVGVVTYMATSIFFGLFDEAVLALMTCLCIDSDLNGKPKFGPPTFHDDLKFFGSGRNQKNSIAYEEDDAERLDRQNTIS